jgi:hypothetical protein
VKRRLKTLNRNPANHPGRATKFFGFLKTAVAVLLGRLLLVIQAGFGEATAATADSAPPAAPRQAGRPPLNADEAARVGAFTAAWFRGETPPATGLPEAFMRQRAVVFVAARAQGERLAHAWHQEATGAEALRRAVDSVREALAGPDRARITALEINLAHAFQPVDPEKDRARLSNVHRGLLGVELVHRSRAYRYAPTEMVAFNLDFDRALERLADRAGTGSLAVGSAAVPVRLFEADQLLVTLGDGEPRTTLMYRGNTLVRIEDITRPAVEALAAAQASWLANNLKPDGRVVYLYWPSRGEESSANNQVRQWMASRALTKLARARGDTSLLERAELNLRYNLKQTYSEDPVGHGLITDRGDAVKLGAVAMAWLALTEHPRREEFASQTAALLKTMDALWQTNGEFRTFWRPPERRDNVNFYPGEALLAWAALFERTRDPARLDRILRSVRFYRDWHRANRNPAFVPWHTQAYFKVWVLTKSAELRDWIFAMNDWLLGVQQWEDQREFPDTMGRFYAPDRPFGPPHASSTAVYLEGLVDAWRLARAVGDAARQEAYRRALIRGLRSLTQLTFLDEVDLFYVSRRDAAFGGVRTTVYDNSIRVDNVQHSLMAALDILEHLPAEDFRP